MIVSGYTDRGKYTIMGQGDWEWYALEDTNEELVVASGPASHDGMGPLEWELHMHQVDPALQWAI